MVVTWPESTTGKSHDSGGCVRLGGCYMARQYDRKVELSTGPVVVGDVGVLQGHHHVTRFVLVMAPTPAAVAALVIAEAATTSVRQEASGWLFKG